MAITPVSKVNSVASATVVSSATTTNKTLQNQLQMKQQSLHKLTNNSNIDAAEKEKERQKLEAEIEELKRRLELIRQKQEEAQKKKASEMEKIESAQETSKTQNEETQIEKDSTSKSQTQEQPSEPIEMSAKEVQQILDRNFTLKEDMIQQGIAYDKENYVRKLSAEIRQDKLYGSDTSSKEEKLDKLQKEENPWLEIKNKKKDLEPQPLINPDVQVIIE